jgi:hypothetical protein
MDKIDDLTFGCIIPAVISVVGVCVAILAVIFTVGVVLTILGLH